MNTTCKPLLSLALNKTYKKKPVEFETKYEGLMKQNSSFIRMMERRKCGEKKEQFITLSIRDGK